MGTLKRKAVKGVTWSAASLWGKQAISLLVFLILSRLLGPEAFGLVAAATVFTALVQILLDQGFQEAIVQRAELEPEHLDSAFWSGIALGVLLMLGGVLLAPWVAGLFHEPQLTPIVRWLSADFVLGALSGTQQAILQRQMAFRALGIRTLSATLAGGVAGVILAFRGAGVWSLVVMTLVEAAVDAILLWSVSGWRPGFNVSWRHYRELFAYGVNVIGNRLLGFLNRRSDNLIVGYFLGPVALGYYTVAYRLLPVALELLTGITTAVAMPVLSRLQRQPDQMRDVFYQVTRLTSLIAFPVFTGMSLLAPEIVELFFGAKWAPSAPVMRVLALVGILLSVYQFNGVTLRAAGRPNWALGIAVLNAIGNVAAFLIAVRWGITAVAAGYVIRGYLLAPIPIIAVHALIRLDVRTYLTQFRGPLAASVLMAASVLGLKAVLGDLVGLPIQLGAYVVVGMCVYVLVMRLVDPISFRQMLELARLARPERRGRRVREEQA